jgi:hypothetical protein
MGLRIGIAEVLEQVLAAALDSGVVLHDFFPFASFAT